MTKLNSEFVKDPWRVFRIMSEFVDGFEELSDIHKAVSIFGSSRITAKNPYYKLAQKTAGLFARSGYAIITGAGSGVMEAANRGAKEAGGESIGLNILIPAEQRPNKYLTRVVEFRYFFCRRVMFAKYSQAFLIFPGGYGTLDEFLEAITLIQTGKIEPRPVILFKKKHWDGLLGWIKDVPLKNRMIRPKHLGIFQVVETAEEALKIVKKYGRR